MHAYSEWECLILMGLCDSKWHVCVWSTLQMISFRVEFIFIVIIVYCGTSFAVVVVCAFDYGIFFFWYVLFIAWRPNNIINDRCLVIECETMIFEFRGGVDTPNRIDSSGLGYRKSTTNPWMNLSFWHETIIISKNDKWQHTVQAHTETPIVMIHRM